MNPTRVLLASLWLVVLGGCQPPDRVGPPLTQEQVQAFFDRYAELWMAGDVDAWVALWTDDGVQMPHDEPRVVGMEQLRARNAAVIT